MSVPEVFWGTQFSRDSFSPATEILSQHFVEMFFACGKGRGSEREMLRV